MSDTGNSRNKSKKIIYWQNQRKTFYLRIKSHVNDDIIGTMEMSLCTTISVDSRLNEKVIFNSHNPGINHFNLY